MTNNKQIVLMVALALVGGCYQGVDGDVIDEITEMREQKENAIDLNGTTFNGLAFNGFGFNGIAFNGVSFNGFSFNGVAFNGIAFNGVAFNGVAFNDVWLDGSSVEVKKKHKGKWIKKGGEELVGMDFKISAEVIDDEGEEHVMDFLVRANDIYRDPNYDDIFYYDLSVGLEGTDQWQPLCEGGSPAIPLRNYWNEETGERINDKNFVTFACTTGVLAHCVEWGYRPWAEGQDCFEYKVGKKIKKVCWDVSLQDHHQACTRMARADYCGDGTAWTVPGTPIDIFDSLDPHIEQSETDWEVEAEWNPNGAYCLNDIRQQGWKAQGLYPKCKGWKAKEVADCGKLSNYRALLGSKFEPVD